MKEKAKYAPNLFDTILFSSMVLVLLVPYTVNSFTLTEANAETIVQNCSGCLNNTKTQVLTIFNFQTEDNPFLAGNATFLVMPNPYSHTTNSTDYLDLTTWFNFVVTDDGKFDSDPTPGIIELVGVNNGTYSIMQIKGSPGFGMAPYSEASDEIFGTTGYSYVTQTFVNFTITTSKTVEPPHISDETFNKLKTTAGGAKVNGLIISSANDLPAAVIVNKDKKLESTPPEPVVFSSSFDPNIDRGTLFNTLGIPTYSAPKGLAVSDQSVFTPPVFVAPVSGGGNFLMSPIIDEISPGSNIMLRYDNVDQGTTHPLIKGIELPMNTNGANVGINVMTDTSNPKTVPIPSGNVALYLDFQTTGNVNFGESSVFSSQPTVYFNVEKDGTACPTGVVVYLYNSGHWHEVTPEPTHDASGDTTHTCAYSVGVDHFSSYIVASDSAGHDHGGDSDGTDHSHTDSTDHTDHTTHSTTSGHVHGATQGHEGHESGYPQVVKDLNIFEIAYNLDEAIARVTIGTTGDVDDVEVQIYSMVGGLRMAHLARDQPFTSNLIGQSMKKYVFEVPLDPHETFFRASVEDKNYNLNQSVFIGAKSGKVIPWFANMQEDSGHTIHEQMAHAGEGSDITNTGFEIKFDGGKKTVSYNGVEFPIKYEMAGNISSIEVDEQAKSVTFLLNSVSGGELLLQVPRSLIDATDDNFIVLMTASPQTEINYAVTASTPEYYTLKVTLPEGAEKLTIVGTKVVPEFGAFAILVLVVALVSIITYLRTTKNFKLVVN